jgi:Co/Zn/Cd efflux system component
VPGSVALLADSVDFLEDTSVNLLVFVALGWPMAQRALSSTSPSRWPW